eukprot:scaffold1875_cov253-Pinguiococcus_pyrenoidosus.AAC.25
MRGRPWSRKPAWRPGGRPLASDARPTRFDCLQNIGQDFGVAFDMDEDGEVGQEDIIMLKDLILGILSANVAGSGGFAAGFSIGIRY